MRTLSASTTLARYSSSSSLVPSAFPSNSGHLPRTTSLALLETSALPPPGDVSASFRRRCARLRKSSLALCIVARFLLTPSSEKAAIRSASGRTSSLLAATVAAEEESVAAEEAGEGDDDDEDWGDQPMRATKLRSASGSYPLACARGMSQPTSIRSEMLAR